jgi:hypothetical protein
MNYKSILRRLNDEQKYVWHVKHWRDIIYVMNVDDSWSFKLSFNVHMSDETKSIDQLLTFNFVLT